jgi:EAL domain-containing protein (putative c-di-GMP-specific phosphodiesterase class I)
VSQRQLISLHFAEKLYQEVAHLKLNPKWIDLEITESLHLQENPDILKTLEDFRKFGFAVSIDDFGTGFSSLSYLKSLPANRIKLARELVSSVHTDDFDYQLVKSMIELSKAKDIKIIAEGVETEEQMETLKQLNCDEVQGFLLGRPMPLTEIEEKYRELSRNNHSQP